MTYKTLIVGIALAVAAATAQAESGDQAFVTTMAGVAMGEVELGMLAQDRLSKLTGAAFDRAYIDAAHLTHAQDVQREVGKTATH